MLPVTRKSWLRAVSLLIACGTITAAPLDDPKGSVDGAILQPREQNPCAQVSALLQTQQANNSTTYLLKPSLALACLNDIPLDIAESTRWLNNLRPFLEFQTTFAYLKSPGEQYKLPALDFLGIFDSYVNGLSTGMFSNQYALEYAITNLFSSAHDGHFSYLTTLPAYIFNFIRPVQLVSYASSKNGSEPQVYIYEDVLAASTGSYQASSISGIDGKAVSLSLEHIASFASNQDPDANYNQLMHTNALTNIGEYTTTGVFTGTVNGWQQMNDTTTFQFSNGSTVVLPNTAAVLVPDVFTKLNITSGADISKIYTDPAILLAITNTTSSNLSTAIPSYSPRPAFPKEVARISNNYAAGYYLSSNSSVSSQVAILSIPTFNTLPPGPLPAVFQKFVYDFLNNSTSKNNKTKLIIDVSSNGGGNIYQGYNVFKNLFPDLYPYQTSRERAHPALNGIGQIASKYTNSSVYFAALNATSELPLAFLAYPGSELNYREAANAQDQNFASWADLYGPHQYKGDNFTSLFQPNLTLPQNVLVAGIDVNGFSTRSNTPPSRPFPSSSDIIILTDGICASTCSIFVELMREVAGVKVVTVGGRPNGQSSMAAVGGTRGTRTWSFGAINAFANASQTIAELQGTVDDVKLLNDTGVTALIKAYEQVAVRGSGYVNSRDLISKADQQDGVPAQFRYDPADCRIWYTAKSAFSPEALWEDVVKVAWGGEGCVGGKVVTIGQKVASVGSRSSGSMILVAMVIAALLF